MAENAPVVEPQNQPVPPVAETPEQEVVTLKAKVAELEPKAQKADELQGNLDNAVSELIVLRKKKAVAPEELEKLENLVKDKDAEIVKLKAQRNESVLNSLASQPKAAPTPKTADAVILSSVEEKLRASKGWTIEKFVNMKAKYGNVIFPKGI